MKVVIDIEADGLENVKNIWLICCKDIDTGVVSSFREVTSNVSERERFKELVQTGCHWIGHNILGFDLPVLASLLEFVQVDPSNCTDTLIISKMADYPRKGDSGGDDKRKHSIEAYGEEFGCPKGTFSDFSKYSTEMEEYCVRDVDIAHRVYNKYIKFINNPAYHRAILVEHKFQLIVNQLHDNGFAFDSHSASTLLTDVTKSLDNLDKQILAAFPPRLKLIREITPRETKHGTLNKADFRFVTDGDLSVYNGGPFCRCTWSDFNPASHRQIIDVLHDAGWEPVNKTKTRIDCEREIARSKFSRTQIDPVVLAEIKSKLENLEKYGWKVDELNVSSLPAFEEKLEWVNNWRIKISKIDELTRESLEREIQTSSKLSTNEITKSISCVKELNLLSSTIKIQDMLKTNSCVETMAYLLKILSSWYPHRTDVAEFVEKENHSWLITVTPQDIFVDCSASFVTDTWAGLRDTTHLQQTIFKLKAARLLAQRILLESRRRTLTEWLSLVGEDGRIRGSFFGIGAWTHRMSHQNPNTANIPNATDLTGQTKLYGKEMRSLWVAPKKRLLVGVDAEGIQLRIFAHYINDEEFIHALVTGDKKLKTDPHSLNQRIMGSVCKSRAASKRFIFAYLLGAGIGKLAEILGSSTSEAENALARLYERYSGFQKLKEEIIPRDAKRGFFIGLDGRPVRIIGDTSGTRRHLCMSGYLQNGEKVVMSHASVRFAPLLKGLDSLLVNLVHDEWQTETPNDMKIALQVAQLQADSLRIVGEELKLNCPLAGSYWNEDAKDYTIGTNWYQTH